MVGRDRERLVVLENLADVVVTGDHRDAVGRQDRLDGAQQLEGLPGELDHPLFQYRGGGVEALADIVFDLVADVLELLDQVHGVSSSAARKRRPLRPGQKKYSPPRTVTVRDSGPKRNGGSPGIVSLRVPSWSCGPSRASWSSP